MIDIVLYRSRIGTFLPSIKSAKSVVFRGGFKKQNSQFFVSSCVFFQLFLLLLVSSAVVSEAFNHNFKAASNEEQLQNNQVYRISSNKNPNFLARIVNGNIKKGVVNIHINIRSMYNKMSEVKNLIKKESPHILGISETELRKSHHSLDSLKVPGYDLILPKSWESYGRARVVIYIKKSLVYEHLPELEHSDIQSVWIKAGFKNTKKIYFSHLYREHTNSMGGSMASQRAALEKMLGQWDDAVVHGQPDEPNEVHIAGDMNLDCLDGRWLEPDYPLVTLSRMVMESCNMNNFSQVVDKVTRVQFNRVKNITSSSCIDHVYCNTKHRISPIKVISSGASDHDAIAYTRFSKDPVPPSRTIRRRSYKNFNKEEYLKDIANIDFTDVYTSVDVDDAASLLTQKLVVVLNKHAPWIIYQQRKKFSPWISSETLKLMEQRDEIKEKAKVLGSEVDISASREQAQLWNKYKKLRNLISNRIKHEEILFKRNKVEECEDCPSKTWKLAKSFMQWTSSGPPTQLEVEQNNKIVLCRKAKELAKVMNEFFISKVEKIVEGLPKLPVTLSGCEKLMEGKNISFSTRFVSVQKIRKLLGSLKNKTSTAVDQLDNYAVKVAADYIAGPLHHVVTLSLMQQKFPQDWKFSTIVPLHKKSLH